MCSYEEWESLRRRFQHAVDDGQLRDFVEDAAARFEALLDDLKGRGCQAHDAEWARGRGRHSRTEWVA